MARVHLRYPVKDQEGRVIQNATVYVREIGTATSVTDAYAASSGGSPLTMPLTSNNQGDVECWLAAGRAVDLYVTDNSNAAYYADRTDSSTLDWTAFTESANVGFNATEVTFTPTGTIAAVTVAAAIAEVSGDVTDHLADTTDAHAASAITNTPAAGIAATTVQAAITELAGDTTAHLADAADAHAATAITNTPAGGIAATTVQAAITELDTEKAPKAAPAFTGNATIAGTLTLGADAVLTRSSAAKVTVTSALEAATITQGGAAVLDTAHTSDTTPHPNERYTVRSSAINTALVAATDEVLLMTSASPRAVTLPTAVGIEGKSFIVKNASTGTVTITPDGSETIDGAASYALVADEFVQFMSDNANWVVTQYAAADATEAAVDVVFTPAGNIAAVNVQAAIEELDTEKVAAASHTTVATDTVWDAAGDVVVGTGANTAGKVAISVPDANILNVLGVVNGESTVSWKPVHDATAPSTQAFGDSATAGTALTAAHRDHKHAMPAMPDASDIVLPTVGTPTYSTVEDLQTIVHSSGWVSGGVISCDVNGIDVTGGDGLLRSSNSRTAQLSWIEWPAVSNQTGPTSGNTKFVGVEYNAGTPQVTIKDTDTWNYYSEFPLGSVTYDGTDWHVSNIPWEVGDHAGLMVRQMRTTMPWARDMATGGLVVADVGANNDLTLSAGALWYGLTRTTFSAVDTSAATTFDLYYKTTGTWTELTANASWAAATAPTVNMNQTYQNGASTAELGVGKYGILWFYLDTSSDRLVALYGTAQYNTSAAAEQAAPPTSLPPHITQNGVLLGRFIFVKSATAATSVASVWDTTLNAAGVTDHGDLAGLGDDDHTQYVKHSLADAAGDILVASANDTFAKLTKGSEGSMLGVEGGTVTYTYPSLPWKGLANPRIIIDFENSLVAPALDNVTSYVPLRTFEGPTNGYALSLHNSASSYLAADAATPLVGFANVGTGLAFDGATNYATAYLDPATDVDTGIVIVMGLIQRGYVANNEIAQGVTAGTSATIYQGASSGDIKIAANGSNIGPVNLALNTPGVITAYFNGGTSALRLNDGTAVTGSLGNADLTDLYVGGGASTVTEFDFNFLLVATGVTHDSTAIVNTVAYLMARYGI